MNNKNCIKQNLLGQILILFRQENLRRKPLLPLKPPFHNMEVIMDIEFYLLNTTLLSIKMTPWIPLYLLRINITANKMGSAELDWFERLNENHTCMFPLFCSITKYRVSFRLQRNILQALSKYYKFLKINIHIYIEKSNRVSNITRMKQYIPKVNGVKIIEEEYRFKLE